MARRDLTGAVDFDYLETYAAGDFNLVEDVLGMFREQTTLWLPLLDPAGDPGTWRDGAHTLKGASLGVGAFELARVCGEAETSTDLSLGARSAQLEHIRNALDAALSDIAAYAHERALQSLKTPGEAQR